MKFKSLILLTLIALITLVGVPAYSLNATEGDDVDGSFESVGFNNPLELRGFQVIDQEGNPAYSFNPREFYTLQLTVHDEDSIADLKSLAIVFYYATAPIDNLEELIDSGTSIMGEEFVMTWTRDSAVTDPGFVATAPAVFSLNYADPSEATDISWEITSSTTPAILGGFDNELSTKTFTFEVEFRVSKVAPQTSSGEWRFGIKTVDGLFPNDSTEDLTTSAALRFVESGNPLQGTPTLFNMNWYGEVGLDLTQVITWTNVVPPLDFGGTNSLATSSSIIFISNGTYQRATAASGIWTITGGATEATDGSTMAALTSGTLDGAQQFGLKAGLEGIASYNTSSVAVRLEPENESLLQYVDLGSEIRTDEIGNTYTFMYWLSLSPQFQNATYLGDIGIKINNFLDVATIGTTAYATLGEAVEVATAGAVIKLLSNTTEDISLTTAVSIDFNGFTLTGNLNVEFDETATITFSGFGILRGNLTVNAPNLTLNTNLTVTGDTTINAVAPTSFNTSGVHTNGITVLGPGRINATNETKRPNIFIQTTAAIVIDGFVNEVNVTVDNASISLNASVQKLNASGRPLQLTLGQAAKASIQNLIKNVEQNQYYNSIQAAINAASIDDTIEVGPGTYIENIIINKEGLKLLGPNADITGSSINRSQEAIILGTVEIGGKNAPSGPPADNAHFSGFTLINEGTQNGTAINSNSNDIFVKNNIIINYRTGFTSALAGGNVPLKTFNLIGNLFVSNLSAVSTEKSATANIEFNTFLNNRNGIGFNDVTTSFSLVSNHFVIDDVIALQEEFNSPVRFISNRGALSENDNADAVLTANTFSPEAQFAISGDNTSNIVPIGSGEIIQDPEE